MSLLVTFPSAGHHNNDSGASYNGRQENEETIRFRNALVKELVASDVHVITDKDWETNRQYQRRIRPGNGSVVLDIHFNAATPAATGTEAYIRRNANSLSRQFADEIAYTAATIMGIRNRGVKSEHHSQHSRLGILHQGAGIAALWEICFITNKTDMKKYDAHFHKLVVAVAEICKKYDKLIR